MITQNRKINHTEAVAEYNGSDEYARKVYEYLPYITELLD